MTKELENFVDQYRRIHRGDAWHGVALRDTLDDVTAQMAREHPVAGARSIWELALHIAAWEEVFAARIRDRKAIQQPEEGDFPALQETSDAAWQQTLDRLDRANQLLIDAVSKLSDSDLDAIVPGKDYSLRFMLSGIPRHNVYHAGQIGLLKKALQTTGKS